jgi:NAD(P)-dependent dehydrogenase (short-subunit alcohol dehydrogenase family)
MPLPVPDISRNLFDLGGYCSIVTGAGQGIGLALAEALAHAGSDLVLTGRDAAHLESAAGRVEAIGRRVATVAGDVTADDTPDRLVAAALDLGDRIDVLVNNAGAMTFADMLSVDDAVWDGIYALNGRAPMRIMRAVLPRMVAAERGSVINIGSSWSSRASVFNQDGGGVDYCSSKAALQALTRAAAQDVAAHGVRVNAIAPGAVDTPMHADHRATLYEYERYIPLGRMQLPEDLAGAAIFLASDASGYITGQTLHVNGGLIMND